MLPLRPRVVHLEVQPLVPPPVQYRQRWQEELVDVTLVNRPASRLIDAGAPGSELPGCSVAVPLPGYVLSHLEFENAVYVREDLAPLLWGTAGSAWHSHPEFLRQVWTLGVFCHPLYLALPEIADFAEDFRAWATRPDLVKEFFEREAPLGAWDID